MGLSADDRASLMGMSAALAPGEDAADALRFVRDREEDCLDELGAVPGHDQVRAILLRLLPAWQPDAAVQAPRIAAATAAMDAYLEDPLEDLRSLERHPAWAGMCAIEIGALQGGTTSDPETLDRAVALALHGFEHSAPHEPHDRGEILWALAEVASDVGWEDHVGPLLDAAVTSTFADDENRGKVALIRALRGLYRGSPPDAVTPEIDAILAYDVLDPQTRIHALWVGAQLDRQTGRHARAVLRLQACLDLVDADEEPEVVERIHEVLSGLGVRHDDAAEA